MTTLTDLFGLKGHRAIVTGASSGLGVEFAEALAIADVSPASSTVTGSTVFVDGGYTAW